MARTKPTNGHDRLEDAISNLLQTQAAFLARVAETDRQLLEIKKEMIEAERQGNENRRLNNERFARVEATLLDHTRILQELSEAIQELPDAIRGKFGFRPPE